MKVYGDIQSGNCYKIKLLMSFLNIQHEWIAMDILQGDTEKVSFLVKNPNGKIPLLELDDGTCLSESNAILNYLAHNTIFSSSNAFEHSQILQWQFFEQYSHEPYIAVARFIEKYLGLPADRHEEYLAKQSGGHKALTVMEQHLSSNQFFVGERLTIADISLYAYTHVAGEGGFDLSQYPATNRWLDRIASTPAYVSMNAMTI
ncbi:MAG: glutathione S-transferase family protein [Gammaproteobacteria bacterium]|nr:glutathione S-transferase family protein [Gammaproteobacteria bacterium]